jgi:hypothetical protein
MPLKNQKSYLDSIIHFRLAEKPKTGEDFTVVAWFFFGAPLEKSPGVGDRPSHHLPFFWITQSIL